MILLWLSMLLSFVMLLALMLFMLLLSRSWLRLLFVLAVVDAGAVVVAMNYVVVGVLVAVVSWRYWRWCRCGVAVAGVVGCCVGGARAVVVDVRCCCSCRCRCFLCYRRWCW